MPTTKSRPQISYERFGEQGSPALFIMGFGMPGLVWKPQVRELQKDHQCCYYDHLGVGGSEPPQSVPTMQTMAADAVRLLDELGWERAHVVGVSMGGMIAQELAIQTQRRCLSLTLIATHAGGPLASLPTLRGTRLFLQTVVARGKRRVSSLERLLYPAEYLRNVDPTLRRRGTKARLGQPPSRKIVAGHFSAVRGHDTEARLSQLTLPTLLVRPGLDILIRPSEMDRLARAIPHARVLRFDDAGHGVTFQKAAELNAALREHFAAADQDRAAR